jgi:tetratricopeptide (TPR) repeat protein
MGFVGVLIMEESVKLFISYSHRDEKLRQQLDKHLAPLKRQKVIEAWHDRQIPAGTEWANEIDENLSNADIILLLVSPDFVASDYCSNIELEIAMSRHQQGAAIIIPIVLEPCDWSWLPFAKFQAFPKDALAVTSWTNQNEAFVDVATGIRKVAHDMLAERQGELRRKEADREKYKAKVEQVLSISTNGEISVADRDTLEELRESLDLTAEEAQQAENSAYKPFIDRAEKQEKYKKTLLKYIENYPFSEDIIKQLENRQRDLGLKTDDIEQVTRPILTEADKNYQEKLQVKGVERRSEIEEESGNPDSLSSNLDVQRKNQEAVECCRTEKETATINTELGRSLHYQGRYEEAIRCYQKAIKIDPSNAKTHYNLGISLSAQGRYEEAIECYQKAIEIDPSNAKTHYNLGISLSVQGRYEEAIECYRKAIEIDPNESIFYANLGDSLASQEKHEEAIKCYQKEIIIDPNAAGTYNNLGAILASQGKYEEAIKCYQKAIGIDPNESIFYANLGESLASQEKHEEAIKCYRKAIEIDPNIASHHCNLGIILASQEKHEEAIKCYQKAIGIDPNDVDIHYNLEFSLKAQDQKKKFLGLF